MKFVFYCLLIVFISSCTSYVQLYETRPISTLQSSADSYTFENDTLKIVYSFWANHGSLSYSVFNKMEVPIYIDWKKSSYIRNSQKINYWKDITSTSGMFNTSGSVFRGSIYENSLLNVTSVKPESISFIAPKSTIYLSQFALFTSPKTDLSEVFDIDSAIRTDNSAKKTELRSQKYNETNSPLIFRNFLTISTSDKFEKDAYIDNGFYLYKVTEMDKRHFQGKEIMNNDDQVVGYQLPFKTEKGFYVIVK